jgi:hypothetical protein
VYYLGESLPTGRTGKIDRGQFQSLLSAGTLQTLADRTELRIPTDRHEH